MPSKNVGMWYGNVFLKITKSKYFYRAHQGWAIDGNTVDNSNPDDLVYLQITDGNKDTLKTTMQTIREHGKPIFHTGYGRQYVLPAGRWEFVSPSTIKKLRNRAEN